MIDDTIETIRKCIEGDDKAWKSFVKDFASMAKNILAHAFTLSAPEQEDVVQNVFVKLVSSGLKNFNGRSKYEFLRYFKIIVINEARSHVSSEQRRKDVVHLNGELTPKTRNDGEEGLTLMDTIQDQDRNSRPDYAIEDRNLLERTTQIMKTYPLLDQEIFLMKVKGFKDEDIKTILKVPMGTVASKYSRIKDRIMKELSEK
jgi:RNA polymerase sigma factor (sigma-70 family)